MLVNIILIITGIVQKEWAALSQSIIIGKVLYWDERIEWGRKTEKFGEPFTISISQVQVHNRVGVKYSWPSTQVHKVPQIYTNYKYWSSTHFFKVLKYIKYFHIKYKYSY